MKCAIALAAWGQGVPDACEPPRSPTRLSNPPGAVQPGYDAQAWLGWRGAGTNTSTPASREPGHPHPPTVPPVPTRSQPAKAPSHLWRVPRVPAWLFCLEAPGSRPAHPAALGRLPPLPSHPWGPRGLPALIQPLPKLPPLPPERDPLPAASAELHLPPGSAAAWLGLSSFSSLSHSLNALCLLWRRGAGRAPLPAPAPGDPPRQMGPGYECARSEAPKRICWCPFHREPLCAAPLQWDAPEFYPGFSPFHSRRKESAYKGLVCPTCLRGPYCCRCRGSRRDSVAPLRMGDVQLPPGRVRAGGLARRWEKKGFSCISMSIEP